MAYMCLWIYWVHLCWSLIIIMSLASVRDFRHLPRAYGNIYWSRHIIFVMLESPMKILGLQWSKHNSYRVLLTRTMKLVGYFVTPLFCNVLWKRMFVLTNSISWIKSDWKTKITLLYVFLTFIVAVFRNYHTRRFDDSCWNQTKQLNTA